ncbi:gluconokinase [Mesorhizobium sp. LHD-90]|uniref:gluconokinase n=1 Tax=Mesorhizobium sp. LHD-90 TaxID=3071414 RepID=UPI0027E13E4E|nr:gluconokinase [Mesorhizobium sp. LHD-90]MDQ6435534.1 gluconokinase [Mesorhizobium sp. LHD-90]
MQNFQAGRTGPERRVAAIVVMGVSGCGKTLVGEAIAARLGWRFVEGDRLHPPENVAKMASGQPLDDADREGWLDAIGAAVAAGIADGNGVVAACSALKRKYRDRLRVFAPDILFVHLTIDRETAGQRVGSRKGHFMPASLVDSQFAALESPQGDEFAISLNGLEPVEVLAATAVERVSIDRRRRI